MFQKMYYAIGPIGILVIVAGCLMVIPFLRDLCARKASVQATHDPPAAVDTECTYEKVTTLVAVLQICTADEVYFIVSSKVSTSFFTQPELVELCVQMAGLHGYNDSHTVVFDRLRRYTLTKEQKNRIYAAYGKVLSVRELDGIIDFLA